MIKNLMALEDKVRALELEVVGKAAEIDILHGLYSQLEERLTRVEQDLFEQIDGDNEGC